MRVFECSEYCSDGPRCRIYADLALGQDLTCSCVSGDAEQTWVEVTTNAKESPATGAQQPQELHCSHEFVYREYVGQTPGRCVTCGAIVP